MKKIVFVLAFIYSISIQVDAQWELLNSPDSIVRDILILNDGSILCGSSSGLYKSSDNFQSWDSTTISSTVNHIKKDNFGTLYASSDYLFRSTDEGLTWSIPYNIVPDNPKDVQNIFINDSGYIFVIQGYGSAGTYTPGLKSTDLGTTWNIIWNRFVAWGALGIGHSIIENLSGILFVSYEFHVYPPISSSEVTIMKKEPGTNWTTVYNGIIANNMYVNNNDLYVATSQYLSTSLGIIKSTDNGTTFIQLNNGLTNLNIKQLILKPEVFIALNGDGVYRSLDDGYNWMRLDHTGLNGNINRIYLHAGQTLYACTDNGIYVYTGVLPVELTSFTANSSVSVVQLSWSTATELNNHGFEIERSLDKTSWVTIGFREGKGNTSEPQAYTYSDDISEISSSKLYYRLKQIDFDGRFEYSNAIEVQIVSPLKFSLEQNYPNPFNPITKIKYTIPTSPSSSPLAKGRNEVGFVTLKVYDVLGKEVATLVNEEKPSGNYEINFDASNLASGIYYYQLRANSFVETKKMLLLK